MTVNPLWNRRNLVGEIITKDFAVKNEKYLDEQGIVKQKIRFYGVIHRRCRHEKTFVYHLLIREGPGC